MKGKFVLLIGFLVFLTIFFSLSFVSATVDTVVVNYNGDGVNYNYTIIGRSYDLYVAGTNLQQMTSSELQFLSNTDDNLFVYNFTPGTLAGVRTFGTGENQFNLSVLSEADELVNSIGKIVININDTSSLVNIENLNLSGKLIRSFKFDLDEYKGTVDLSKLLRGISFNLNFNKGESYPVYNSLFIDGGSSAGTVVGSVLIFNNLNFDVNDVNSNPSLLNQVIDIYNLSTPYNLSAYAIKSGNNFEFYSDEGYKTLNNADLTNAQEIINEKIKYIDPDEIINYLLPIGNFSEFKKFVDFNTSVDFGNLTFMESGTYALNLVYTDKYGNEGTMPFIVNLDVTNEGNQVDVDSNGTVTFTDITIKQRLEKIEGLPQNISLTSALYGTSRPSSFSGSLPSNTNPVEFMQINSSNDSATDNGNYVLHFKISTSSLTSSLKNNVSLYVEESNAWTKLSTTLGSEDSSYYYYHSTLHHFSNYLIGYYLSPSTPSSSGGSSGGGSSGGGSSSRRDLFLAPLVSIPDSNNGNPSSSEPIGIGEDSPSEPSGFSVITGAVIGAISSPGGIVAIIFLVVLSLLLIMLRLRRRGEVGKKSGKHKLNSSGDKIEKK